MKPELEFDRRQSTSSADPHSLSFYLRTNTENRKKILKQQNENFETWKKEEMKYLNRFLFTHSFKEYPSDGFELARFEVEGEYDLKVYITSQWQALPAILHPKGLELKGCLIKPVSKMRLKSLACEFKLQVKITGDSSLILLTRTEGGLDSDSPFIRISKDMGLNGLYVMFGTVNQSNGRAAIMKQVQVPQEKKKANHKLRLELSVIDNGDSRIFMTVSRFDKKKLIGQFNTHCDTFVPVFHKSRVLVGGFGDSVKMYCFTAQQRERIVSVNTDRDKECRCLVF